MDPGRGRRMIKCFECEQQAEHNHHVVPVSAGGRRTVPLCHACHAKVHGRFLGSSILTRQGLERARARGVKLGRPRVPAEKLSEALAAVAAGKSVRAAAKQHGIGPATLQRALKAASKAKV